MYVLHAYMQECIHTLFCCIWMHVCIYTYTVQLSSKLRYHDHGNPGNVCMYVCMCVRMYLCMHVVHLNIHTHTHILIHTYKIHTRTNKNTFAYMHSHTCTYTHTRTCRATRAYGKASTRRGNQREILPWSKAAPVIQGGCRGSPTISWRGICRLGCRLEIMACKNRAKEKRRWWWHMEIMEFS